MGGDQRTDHVYEFVPFVPRLKVGFFGLENAAAISSQLAKVVQEHQSQGWEYVGLEQVEVTHAAGCLASLFGGKDASVPYDIIVFRARPGTVRSGKPAKQTSARIDQDDDEGPWQFDVDDPDALERATLEAMRQ